MKAEIRACERCTTAMREFMAEGIRTGNIGEPPQPCGECKEAAVAILEATRPAFPWWANLRKRVSDMDTLIGALVFAAVHFNMGAWFATFDESGFVLRLATAVAYTIALLWIALGSSWCAERIALRRRAKRAAAKGGEA